MQSNTKRSIRNRAVAAIAAATLAMTGVAAATADAAAAQTSRTTTSSSAKNAYGSKDSDGVWWQKTATYGKRSNNYTFAGPFMIKYRLANFDPIDDEEKEHGATLYSSEQLALGVILADGSGKVNRKAKNCVITVSIFDEDGDYVDGRSIKGKKNVGCDRLPRTAANRPYIGFGSLPAGDYSMEIEVTHKGDTVGLPIDFTVHGR